MAMLPILFYSLYQIEHKKGDLFWYQSLGRAGVKSVELAPIIMLFPVIWTLYCYYCFGDSLIYKNIRYAWLAGNEPSIAWNVRAVISSGLSVFKGLQYSSFCIYKINFITLSSHQYFSILLILGVLCLPVFIIIKCYDLFVYNFAMVMLWILISGIPDGGRHISLMFSIPFSVVIGFNILQQYSEHRKEYKTNKLVYIVDIMLGVLILAMFSLSIIHFIWYTIRYLNGVWVS
jgi:hypothetical protein